MAKKSILDFAEMKRKGEKVTWITSYDWSTANTFIVGDMPFLSYQKTVEDAIGNAGRFYKEAGVDAIKLEGGSVACA